MHWLVSAHRRQGSKLFLDKKFSKNQVRNEASPLGAYAWPAVPVSPSLFGAVVDIGVVLQRTSVVEVIRLVRATHRLASAHRPMSLS
jgi:hypothetical protein